MEFFIMNREGFFYPSKMTHNQCKVEGHHAYRYELKCVFSQRTILDKDKFIIDHIHIDNLIASLRLSGSCEEMHQRILSALRNLFTDKGIPVAAIKITIFPEAPKGVAHLTYVWASSPRNVHYLSL